MLGAGKPAPILEPPKGGFFVPALRGLFCRCRHRAAFSLRHVKPVLRDG